MKNFVYYAPTRVFFGKGQIEKLGQELKKHARKVLVVSGQGSVKRAGIYGEVLSQVYKAQIPFAELPGIQPNPRLKSVYKGIEICKEQSVDFILGVGGGSVIDAAKAMAMGVKYEGDVWDFFEKDIPVESALPVGTVLTLAATGSEMNGNTVITREDTRRKLAYGSSMLKPVFSILDPEYTFTVNKYHTAAGVADIMAHVFETYFSPTASTDLQDRIAEALLKVCIKYGPLVCENGRDYDARAQILWTGSLAINGLIGKGKVCDWASHAIEHELSAVYDISHGAGLAIITPSWMKNVLNEDTVRRFVEYGVNVWNIEKSKSEMEIAREAISKTREFFTFLGLPSTLSQVGIGDEKFEEMAENALQSWGQVGNFKKLSKEDIVNILKMSV